jgi:HEPN domain-containing protein
MTRNEFKKLARVRIREARVLNQEGLYDGAYHLAGLAVECAFKACIARKTRRHDFPDKYFANQVHTHDFKTLVQAAGLQATFDRDLKANATLNRNWAVVKDWSVESRYNVVGKLKSEDFYKALTARPDGVMKWIRQHW